MTWQVSYSLAGGGRLTATWNAGQADEFSATTPLKPNEPVGRAVAWIRAQRSRVVAATQSEESIKAQVAGQAQAIFDAAGDV